MDSIIITTTNNIEGSEIKGYYTPISANMVIGANIFSDISASWTDFFGGRSGTYERKLQEMYEGILYRLKEQAFDVGANCILGLKVDFGEISGKGNQMFMLSAVGTPVYAELDKDIKESDNAIRFINGEKIETKVRANRIIKEFFDGSQDIASLGNTAIDFILKSRLLDFSKLVVTAIKNSKSSQVEESNNKLKKITSYFRFIEKDEAVNLLYGILSSKDIHENAIILVCDVIKEFDLIDYNKVLELLTSTDLSVKKQGLKILSFKKSNYSSSDISLMKDFIQIIEDGFPKTGQLVTKKGLLSSNKEAWLCQCGKTNELYNLYCENCEVNKYGFVKKEISHLKVLNLIEQRLEVIEEFQKQEVS